MPQYIESRVKTVAFLSAILLLIVLSVSLAIYSRNASDVSFINTSAASYNDGWYYYNAAGQRVSIDTLPYKMSHAGPVSQIYHRVDNPKNISYLCLYSHHQNIRLLYNGSEIYSYQVNNLPPWQVSFRSFHHIVPLNATIPGELCVEVTGLTKKHNGEFNEVFVGTQFEIFALIFSQRFYKIFLGFIILIIGISVFVPSILFIQAGKEIRAGFYFAFMSLSIGLWQVEESRLLQFPLGSQSLHWSLEYIVQLITLLFSYLYIQEIVPKKNSIANIVLFWVDASAVTLILLFQFTGTIQIQDSIFVVQILFVVSMLYIVYILNHYMKNISRNMRLFTTSTIIVCMVLFAIVISRVLNTVVADAVMSIAMIATFTSVAVITFQIIQRAYQNFRQSGAYQKLAMIDFSTGVSSHTAWYNFVENYEVAQNAEKNYCLFFFDMNNLRDYNQNYGYLAGEKIISALSTCLKATFVRRGEIYRVGGDKFVCLCANLDSSGAHDLLSMFDTQVENVDDSLKFTSAYGFVVFSPREPKDFYLAMEEAERSMLEMKRSMKVPNSHYPSRH